MGFEGSKKGRDLGFGGRKRVERFSKLMASAKVFWFQNYIGKSLWFEEGEYICLIKRNKSYLKIKK